MIVQVDTYTQFHAKWLMFSVDGRSRIAFLISIVPIALIAIKLQIQLSGLHFCLLQTEKVSIQLLEYLTKSLTLTSTKAIHVPTNKLHMIIILSAKIQKTPNSLF